MNQEKYTVQIDTVHSGSKTLNEYTVFYDTDVYLHKLSARHDDDIFRQALMKVIESANRDNLSRSGLLSKLTYVEQEKIKYVIGINQVSDGRKKRDEYVITMKTESFYGDIWKYRTNCGNLVFEQQLRHIVEQANDIVMDDADLISKLPAGESMVNGPVRY